MTPLTYVYCVVRGARRPSLRGLPAPVPGAGPVRLLDLGSRVWAVVSDVPPDTYGASAIEQGLQQLDWVGARAMAHEAVVEHFLGARAVLPMQLFTMFASDDRAAAHMRRERRRIDRILARVERQVEWGLRVTLDERRRAAMPVARGERRPKADGQSGTAYLARKRDLVRTAQAALARARTEGGRLYRALAREATAAVRHAATERATPGSRVVVDAAFLVPAARTAAFRSSLRREARALSDSGLVVSLTGPWPPYNFVGSGRRPA